MGGPHDATTTSRNALGGLLRPVRGRLVVAVVLHVVGSVVAVVPFVAVAELGRELLGDADPDRMWRIAAVAVAALVARLVLLLGAGAVTHLADNDLQLDLRRRLADHLGRVPLGWFDGRSSGGVKQAVQDDVSAMHHLVGHSLTNLAGAIVTPLVAIGYLLTVDWQLTLVVLIPVAVGLVMYRRQLQGYGEKMVGYHHALGQVNAATVEFVEGIGVVKAFGQTGRAHRRFLDAADAFSRYFLDWVRGMLRSAATTEVVLSPVTMLLAVLAGGTWFVAAGWIEPVDVLPFALLGVGLTAPILTLGYSASDVQIAQQAAGRVSALLATPTLPEPATPRVPAGHRVVFAGVSFSYDGTNDVLADIDLVLEAGTVTALVGPSGSGKTTLAKLLPRFWDPARGTVSLGGVDLRQIATGELYRHAGFVFQDVTLLRTSLRDNIRLARPDASDDDVTAAAEAAQIHERILQLPRGYDSIIGDDARLSGGEAQRVSIARALLADTPLLVLDEATAFADPESEAAIQDALSQLVAGRTLLVIAHRLSTIVHADQIAVVDGGRIVERGRHDDLVAAGGLYRRLWDAHERAGRWQPHQTSLTSTGPQR